MLVHFIGSSKNIATDYPYYRKIIETINERGSVLTRDWIAAAYDENGSTKKDYENNDKINWEEVYTEDCSALERADIAIIEATTYGFQQGFFTSHALRSKKPTLLLFRQDLKNHPLSGIRDRLLTTKEYHTADELEKVVNKFLKDNTISTKDLRFNFFIDRQIYNYLREVSYETGKNKSEIIRDLLEEEIDKKN